MAKSLKPGDHVAWNTSQGETRGVVEKRQTSETHIKGHKVAASRENPEYIVRSDKSGAKAAHRPEALRKNWAGALLPCVRGSCQAQPD